MEYRVEMGIKKIWKRGENTHSRHFRGTCTGTPCTCTGTPFQNPTCTGTC